MSAGPTKPCSPQRCPATLDNLCFCIVLFAVPSFTPLSSAGGAISVENGAAVRRPASFTHFVFALALLPASVADSPPPPPAFALPWAPAAGN